MSGNQHDSNKELVGQGIANCLAAIFGGMPATGAIARTATNIRNGGNSPVAGVVHAITILIVMLLFAPMAGRVPLACMAPVLMVVAYNMSEIHQARHILRGTKSDAIVLGITFFLTVFADLTVAVQFGLLSACVLFIKRMSQVHHIEKVLPAPDDPGHRVRAIEGADCPQAAILNVEGALLFGAATKFEQEILRHIRSIRTLVIRMGRVPIVDATGEKSLHTIWETCRKHNVTLLSTGLQPQPEDVLRSTGLLEKIGRESILARTGPAIDIAIARMDLQVCRTCPHVACRECADLKQRGLVQTVATREEI